LLAACNGTTGKNGQVEEQNVQVPVADGKYYNISPLRLQAMLENKDFTYIINLELLQNRT
jgi:hypothetical protein